MTGSDLVRSNASMQGFLVNSDPAGFANFLSSTNLLTGVNGGLLRRVGLSENFVVANPQVATSYLTSNFSNSSYNSLQVEYIKRFSSGWTMQSNYSWSKTLGDYDGEDSALVSSFRTLRNRSLDKIRLSYDRRHIARTNGIWELPFGPGKPLGRNLHGWLGRLVGGWQIGSIFNAFSGQPISISAINPVTTAGGGTPMILGPQISGSVQRTGQGVVYFTGLQQVTDPWVANITTLQGLQARSTLRSIADSSGKLLLVDPATRPVRLVESAGHRRPRRIPAGCEPDQAHQGDRTDQHGRSRGRHQLHEHAPVRQPGHKHQLAQLRPDHGDHRLRRGRDWRRADRRVPDASHLLRRRYLLMLAAARPLCAAISNLTADGAVNNPYGLRIGPDGALYVCEIGNHRISRLDLKTREMKTVVADQKEPYELVFDPDGSLLFVDMPAHAVRRLDRRTGELTTIATGPLRNPHSIALDPSGRLLICDIGNHRIQRVDLKSGAVDTFAGPLKGPRAIDFDSKGRLFLALREGNAIIRLEDDRQIPVAGTGEKGYSGDGGDAKLAKFSGPKGIACGPDGSLYVADTENHAIRRIDPKGIITTVAGTGERGDGPAGDPLKCRLARPHGVFVHGRTLYIGDSEAHRVRSVQL